MHLPRILLLGDIDRRWAGEMAAALAGCADLTIRPTGQLGVTSLSLAAPVVTPPDGPPFDVVVCALAWDVLEADAGVGREATWRTLARRLAAVAGCGAGAGGLHILMTPAGGRVGPEKAAIVQAAVDGGFRVFTHPEDATAAAAEIAMSTVGGRQLVPPFTADAYARQDGARQAARDLRRWAAGARPTTALRADFRPDLALRDPARAARPGPAARQRAALLMVDAQNFNCDERGVLYRGGGAARISREEEKHFFARLSASVADNWQALLEAARAGGEGVVVLHTVMASQDGRLRDTGLDYRASGFLIPPGSWDARPVATAAPLRGEPVLPKTSSSPFATTALDSLLRSAGVTHLIVAGCVTDQCVAVTTVSVCVCDGERDWSGVRER